jgi:hypothetical protein
MNKLNLLSRAEMRKVMGGNTTPEIIDDGSGGKECAQNVCRFEQAGVGLAWGWCGLSMNGAQCRCINDTASVPWSACLAS